MSTLSIVKTCSLITLVASSLFTGMVHADHHANRLTNNEGMTLYIFDKDKKNESTCYDACAAKWPPYVASEYAKGKWGFKVVKRDDGINQWAYKGQPLYTWVGDSAKGDINGDGVGGVWHIANKKVAAKPEKKSSYGGY